MDAVPSIGQPVGRSARRCRLMRLICSQNPFYLLSVCFVLHAAAQWFHRDSGESFSPWPLLGLIAGYVALLAATGFVIVRFGKVWDDARSILLLILLLFVELSLVFDETLVRDPVTGRLLQLAGLSFAAGLSELLLHGLKIRLPMLFRIPYHLLLGLLFLYPLLLTGPTSEIVRWRIFLFPVAAAAILLTMLPAIRRGPDYTKANGTPWLWPWYPWSLFVFLGVCIGFRAYALSLSFDPILGASLADAMAFKSAFGSYFLVPLIFAVAALLLEVGLVSNRNGAIGIAMLIPLVALFFSVPAEFAPRPYIEFLRSVIQYCGSPLWLALLVTMAFYAFAMLRGVLSARILLTLTLLVATRVGPQTVDLTTLSALQVWPIALLAIAVMLEGILRSDSHRVFTAILFGMASLHPTLAAGMNVRVESAALALLCVAAVLAVGALYKDEFAELLRNSGAPLLVITVLLAASARYWLVDSMPLWGVPVFAATVTAVAFLYVAVAGLQFYKLAGLLSALSGAFGFMVEMTLILIYESSWKGAPSFALGLGWLLLAMAISSWKAGWLQVLFSAISTWGMGSRATPKTG